MLSVLLGFLFLFALSGLSSTSFSALLGSESFTLLDGERDGGSGLGIVSREGGGVFHILLATDLLVDGREGRLTIDHISSLFVEALTLEISGVSSSECVIDGEIGAATSGRKSLVTILIVVDGTLDFVVLDREESIANITSNLSQAGSSLMLIEGANHSPSLRTRDECRIGQILLTHGEDASGTEEILKIETILERELLSVTTSGLQNLQVFGTRNALFKVSTGREHQTIVFVRFKDSTVLEGELRRGHCASGWLQLFNHCALRNISIRDEFNTFGSHASSDVRFDGTRTHDREHILDGDQNQVALVFGVAGKSARPHDTKSPFPISFSDLREPSERLGKRSLAIFGKEESAVLRLDLGQPSVRPFKERRGLDNVQIIIAPKDRQGKFSRQNI